MKGGEIEMCIRDRRCPSGIWKRKHSQCAGPGTEYICKRRLEIPGNAVYYAVTSIHCHDIEADTYRDQGKYEAGLYLSLIHILRSPRLCCPCFLWQ